MRDVPPLEASAVLRCRLDRLCPVESCLLQTTPQWHKYSREESLLHNPLCAPLGTIFTVAKTKKVWAAARTLNSTHDLETRSNPPAPVVRWQSERLLNPPRRLKIISSRCNRSLFRRPPPVAPGCRWNVLRRRDLHVARGQRRREWRGLPEVLGACRQPLCPSFHSVCQRGICGGGGERGVKKKKKNLQSRINHALDTAAGEMMHLVFQPQSRSPVVRRIRMGVKLHRLINSTKRKIYFDVSRLHFTVIIPNFHLQTCRDKQCALDFFLVL